MKRALRIYVTGCLAGATVGAAAVAGFSGDLTRGVYAALVGLAAAISCGPLLLVFILAWIDLREEHARRARQR